MRNRFHVSTNDGIEWYCEQEGSGPDIVLIPDGLGECQMFDKPLTQIAAAGFRVTTFDMPGMSRSANAPIETYTNVTAQRLARYVITLLDELDIPKATVWGCSSGGATVLALCKDHPQRIRNAMAHEVPATEMPFFSELSEKDDESISQRLYDHLIRTTGKASYDGLGPEALTRLRKNYPRWARGYPHTIPASVPMDDLDELARRPLSWTVGQETPMSMFFSNVVGATKAGIELEMLPGGHLVYVSHPDDFARHVISKTRQYI